MSVLTVAIARPTSYIKGPDIASKSERTRQRYKTLLSGQKSLEAFGFRSLAVDSNSVLENEADTITTQLRPSTSLHQSQANIQHCPPHPALIENMCPSPTSRRRMSWRWSHPIQPDTGRRRRWMREWEFDVEACQTVSMQKDDVRGWDVLRDQIKADLKKNGPTLPLSKVNQLLILRNFATLRLKGYRIIPASMEIARQWHEKEGHHFARKVREPCPSLSALRTTSTRTAWWSKTKTHSVARRICGSNCKGLARTSTNWRCDTTSVPGCTQ